MVAEFSPDFEIVEFADRSTSVFPVGVADEDEASVAADNVHHDAELEDGADPLEDRDKFGLRHVSGNLSDEDLAALRRQRPRPVTRRAEKLFHGE